MTGKSDVLFTLKLELEALQVYTSLVSRKVRVLPGGLAAFYICFMNSSMVS